MTLTRVQKDHIKTEIFETLGYASVCWDPAPEGIFEPDKLVARGERLYDIIMNELGDSE